MGYSECSHLELWPFKHCGRFCFLCVYDTDIEPYPVATPAQGAAHNLECTSLVIEQARKECCEIWCHIVGCRAGHAVARWTYDRQCLCANLLAEPQECR
jgi:hypothetical protein